jgi:integrase
MTELRKRMIECLQLSGLAERTPEADTRAVCQLAAHYHKSPDQISEAELRQYFLFLKNRKHYSRNTMTVAICGLRFFYEQTLNRNWAIFGIVRPAPEKKLPVILSLAEVRQILGRIRLARYRVCLTTIYSCGLRLQEGTHLQVAAIDSARLMIHIRYGCPLCRGPLTLLGPLAPRGRAPCNSHCRIRPPTVPTSAANYSRRLSRTLSANAKNQPHWLASSTPRLSLTLQSALFLPAGPLPKASLAPVDYPNSK